MRVSLTDCSVMVSSAAVVSLIKMKERESYVWLTCHKVFCSHFLSSREHANSDMEMTTTSETAPGAMLTS